MKLLLDTHVWIWWNMNPSKLSKKAKEAITHVLDHGELFLAAISVWEFAKLLQLKRLTISCDGESWIDEALSDPALSVVPLSPRIAWLSTQLPAPFHRDPGDQIIVATAREIKATIVTKDELISQYPHVQTLW